MKIISIANHKGGCSKTSLSINLATGFALAKKKVLLIDLDDQCNASDLVLKDWNQKRTILQVLEGKENINDCIIKTELGFDIIPSDLDLDTVDRKCNDIGLLGLRLKQVKEKYEYCIIDNKPSRGSLVKNSLYATKNNGMVLIPVTMKRASFKGFKNIKMTIDDINEMYDQSIGFKIVGSMINTKVKSEKDEFNNLTASLNQYIYKQSIRYQAKPMKVSEDKRSAVILDKKQPIGIDYRKLINEMLGKEILEVE